MNTARHGRFSARRIVALITTLLLVLMPAAAACAQGPTHLQACDTWVVAGPYAHEVGLVASTITQCDAHPAGAFTVTAVFEVNFGGDEDPDWVQVAADWDCLGVPSPGADLECDHVGQDACVPGFDYRVMVTVSGRGPDGTDFFWTMPERPQAHIAECP